MTEPPIDFSPLEPEGPEYWKRLALRIEGAAAGELRRRADVARGPGPFLVRRWAPILAMAATIALAAGAVLFRLPGPRDPVTTAVADLAGVPYEAATLMTGERPPSWGQLMRSDGGGR